MRRIEVTFTPIMELLDEGLRIYRRSFSRFMLLAGLAALPIAAAVSTLFLVAEDLNTDLSLLLFLGAGLLTLPVSLYVMGALSRAAVQAAAGRPVRLRQALAIGPLRTLGMGCYGTLFLIVSSTLVSIVSSICFCGLYLVIVAGTIAFSAAMDLGAFGGAAASLAFGVAILALFLTYIAGLVVNGAVYGSTIYAMQPFVQDELGMSAAVQRSLDLVGYRFGNNLLAFLSASLVFGATALAATLAVGLLLPLPVLFLLGAESAVAQAIAASAWIAAVAAAAPLLPIWMALLYQRRQAAREGEALAEQIAALD
jgi:hypothetical protein